MISRLLVASLVLVLSACSGGYGRPPSFNMPEFPENFEMETPLFDIESSGETSENGCTFGDGTFFPTGTTFNCGGEDEAGTTTQPTPSLAPAAPEIPPAENSPLPPAATPAAALSPGEPINREPINRVATTLLEDEGYEILPYRLDNICHIGMGRVISEQDCVAVDIAREEAERVAAAAWEKLSPIRQDAMAIWCYWSACATFREALVHIYNAANGDAPSWWKASIEIYNSELKEIDQNRAYELAQTIGSGQWRFNTPITDW